MSGTVQFLGLSVAIVLLVFMLLFFLVFFFLLFVCLFSSFAKTCRLWAGDRLLERAASHYRVERQIQFSRCLSRCAAP